MFEVYRYKSNKRLSRIRGAGEHYFPMKVELVEAFDNLASARTFIAGRHNHFLKIPTEAEATI